MTSVFDCIHQAKAAYRLLDCPSVTHQSVLGGHFDVVRQELREPGVYLLIEDSTTAGFPGLTQAAGLGPIGKSSTRGLWLHSNLAMRWNELSDSCDILGLLDQQAWARPPRPSGRRKSTGKGKESNTARQKRKDRESKRWAAALAYLSPHNDFIQYIYVADRESDIYEVIQDCQSHHVAMVVRASHPRSLAGEFAGVDLMSAVAGAAVIGTMDAEISRENRTAKVELRSVSVELRGPSRPGGRLPNLKINVVQAREIDPPEGCEPVSWILLTTLPVQTLEQCRRVVNIYRRRWLIEELHKAMKTGLRLEDSQLSDFRRLSSLAAIISVSAIFLLQAKWQARTRGDEPLPPEQIKTPMVIILKHKYPPKDQERLDNRWLWRSIAKLGGFPGRKGDGDPGWLTLWRGWRKLQLIISGYELRIE
jgi:Transposase Tn5 dimerisation domain/Transposase DDE domain